MRAAELYSRLEKDFIFPGLSDDWARFMTPLDDFLTYNYKKRSMGLVCGFTTEVNKVFTAVFPSDKVMEAVLGKKTPDAMLFLHHPSVWEITGKPSAFHLMNRELLEQFKYQHISIYNLHVPLDNFSEYSTSGTLAKALGLTDLQPFYEYYGSLACIYGKTACKTVNELREVFAAAMGHRVSMYLYGEHQIRNGTVAVAAGGGNIIELQERLARDGVNILVTGVTINNEHTESAHDSAREKKINLLGGTHYSTEKPACQAMCGYFQKLGLPSEFIEGEPGMADL